MTDPTDRLIDQDLDRHHAEPVELPDNEPNDIEDDYDPTDERGDYL